MTTEMMIWSWDDDKLFYLVLSAFPENYPNRWENIAVYFPDKPKEELKKHYDLMKQANQDIEAGLISMPNDVDNTSTMEPVNMSNYVDNNSPTEPVNISFHSETRENKKQKKNLWSEEEHRLFLDGLNEYEKGDWKGISRNSVRTRTPAQVASHAQKYFERQKLNNNQRKRKSIHDITISGAYQ